MSAEKRRSITEKRRSITLITPSDLDPISMAAAVGTLSLRRIDVCYTPDQKLAFDHRLADIQYQIGYGYVPVRSTSCWLWTGRALPESHEAAILSSTRRMVTPQGWNIDNPLSPHYSFLTCGPMEVLSPLSTALSIMLVHPSKLTICDMRGLACLIDSELVTVTMTKAAINRLDRKERTRARAIWNDCNRHIDNLLINRKDEFDTCFAELLKEAARRNLDKRNSRVQALQAELGVTESKYRDCSAMCDRMLNHFEIARSRCELQKGSVESARLSNAIKLLNLQGTAIKRIKIAEKIRLKILISEEVGNVSFMKTSHLQDVERIIKALTSKYSRLNFEIERVARDLAAGHESSDCKCIDPDDMRSLVVDRVLL